jgi:hypothetical protein
MASQYFRNFPLRSYTLDPNDLPGQYLVVTDIFKRVRVHSSVLNDARVYYPYQIKDGDTLENIAHRYYGQSEYYWVILLINEMIDPLRNWPKSYQAFLNYIEDQYGSIETAMNSIHHYEKIITKVNSGGETTTETYIIDLEEYNTLVNMVPEVYSFDDGGTVTVTTTRSSVDSYTYEENENEAKRSIILLKAQYVDQIKHELETLIGS